MWERIFLLLLMGGVYSFFQSPGLTGGDAGDLVAAAALRGVAHPPGYPLYTFLGSFLTKIPIGPSLAYRVGWLSSLPSALSVVLAFLVVQKITRSRLVGLVAAFSLAFNYLFWLYAEVQEVFGLHLFFLFLTLFLALLWLQKPQAKILYLLALITGLELAHHHTYVLIFPAFAYLFWLDRRTRIKKEFYRPEVLIRIALFFLVGASFYLYIPLARAKNPLLGWGPIENAESFLKLITRASYGTLVMVKGGSFSLSQSQSALSSFFYFLTQEFFLVGLIFITLGFLNLFRRQRSLFYFLLLWFVLTGPFFQFYASFPVSGWFSLATIERFYLLPYPALVIWLGVGLDEVRKRLKAITPAGALLLLYPLFLFWFNWEKNDFRQFYEFDHYIERAWESCPAGSVLLIGGDLSVFALLYQYAAGRVPPDLILVDAINPKPAIFFYDELASLRPIFDNPKQLKEAFWPSFRQYLSEKNLMVCTNKSLAMGENYSYFPRGLLFVYTKESAGLDYERIFEENAGLWQSYHLDQSLLADARRESYFTQNLLGAYREQLLRLSEFFFTADEYDQARYWLKEARKLNPEAANLVRLDFLLDVKEKKCSSAQEKLEKNRENFEKSRTWSALEAVYKKECLKP